MEHRPYPKIGTRADPLATSGGPWVATEKLHGAQLVIASDGAVAKIGKRKAWLADDEPFFGWQLHRRTLEAAAHAIQRAAGATVRVFGEIFGGAYPHPDVEAVAGTSPVQTGVWYAPEVRFAVFDILIEAGDDEGELLAHREVDELATAAGLLVVPLLGRGPRAELERLPVRFSTRTPGLLGLPAIDGNVAEGLVLKPDARCAPSARAIVKRKIPEFDEQRFDESAPWDPMIRLDVEQLTALAARLVNPARVASARSKVGDAALALRDEIVLDVLIDLEAAYPRAWRDLTAEAEDQLRAAVISLTEAALAGR